MIVDDGSVVDTKGWQGWEWTHGVALTALYHVSTTPTLFLRCRGSKYPNGVETTLHSTTPAFPFSLSLLPCDYPGRMS